MRESPDGRRMHRLPSEVVNPIQLALMEKFDNPAQWVLTYGNDFRGYVENNPDIVAEFNENPDRCIESLKKRFPATH